VAREGVGPPTTSLFRQRSTKDSFYIRERCLRSYEFDGQFRRDWRDPPSCWSGLTQRHTCALLREVACLSFGSTPKDRRGKAFGIKFSFRNTLPDGGSLAGYWAIAFRSRYELRPAGPLRAAFAVSASFKKFEGLLDSRPDSRLCRHLRSPATTKTNQDRRRIMSTRARYQFGCLTRRKRIRAADVWQFRFYETIAEGRRCRRSRMIGTLAQYPTRTDILRVVERLRLRINLKHRFAMPVTLGFHNAKLAILALCSGPPRHRKAGGPSVSLAKLIDDYLDEAHRDNPGTGCAFSALAPEIARSDKQTRALTSEQVRNDIQLIAGLLPGKDKSRARSRAILTFSALVGAMSLARRIDEGLSREILETVGQFLKNSVVNQCL